MAMSEQKVYPVSESTASHSHLNKDSFQKLYQQSIDSPEEFWAEQAGELLHWHKPWQSVCKSNLEKAEISWFEGAKLNVAYNCIDKHLEQRGNKPP